MEVTNFHPPSDSDVGATIKALAITLEVDMHHMFAPTKVFYMMRANTHCFPPPNIYILSSRKKSPTHPPTHGRACLAVRDFTSSTPIMASTLIPSLQYCQLC